jgi:hypothetical protein
MLFFGGSMPLLRTSTASGSSGSAVSKPSSILSSSKSSSNTLGAGDIAKIGGPTNTPTPNAANGGISKSFPKTVAEARKPIDVRDNKSIASKLDLATKLSDPKSIVQDKFTSLKSSTSTKLANSTKILDKAGADIIKSAKSQVLDALDSLLVIPEPVLLATLKGIAALGGRPDYKSYYSLKEMIKKDYDSIVKWMVEEFNMSPVSGSAASVLSSSPSMGATKCSLYVLEEKAKIKGPDWIQKNRYAEMKKILISCKINFDASRLTGALSKYNIDVAGLGETGTKEFGIKYKHAIGDVNRMFPEKKKALYWETYPLTPGHVTLYNQMLDGKSIGDKLVHKIIWKRLRQNVVVVNPIVGIISNATDQIIKELGIDKIVNAVTNKQQLMYLYIKEIKAQKLL